MLQGYVGFFLDLKMYFLSKMGILQCHFFFEGCSF